MYPPMKCMVRSARVATSSRQPRDFSKNSPDSASKAGSDMLVRAYYHTYGLPMVITNCSNNYGPYELPEKLIPVVIQNCLTRKPIPVYGDGINVRDWLYVLIMLRLSATVETKGTNGETYNIGWHNEWTNIKHRKIDRSDLIDETRNDSSVGTREN